MICKPIRFGKTNDVPDATITSTVTPDTSLDWLKDEFKARLVRFTDLSSADIVIELTLPETRVLEYFALPGSNLTKASQFKLEVFDDAGTKADILGRGFQEVATPLPAGIFRAGIDKWAELDDSTIPDVHLIWIDTPVEYRGIRLTITHGLTDGVDEVLLRMLMMGEKLELENTYSFGGDIAFDEPADLVRTTSGSKFPQRDSVDSRDISLPFDAMTEIDLLRMKNFRRSLQGRPFIVDGRPEDSGLLKHDYKFVGRFEGQTRFSHRYINQHTTTINIVEV